MSAPKHTAGPWVSCGEDRGGCSCGHVWSKPADQLVATANTVWGDDLSMPDGEIPADQMRANARLIAAAPDFFASAASLIEAWDARTTGAQQALTGKSDADLQRQAMDAIQGLRAAIAKATGADQ